MAVPKKHKTRSGRNQRRAHDFLKPSQLSVCKNCNYPVMPHQVCPNCGYYKGRQVLKIKSKAKARA